MKYYLNLGFRLMLIAGIASAILAFVNDFTAPIISENQSKAEVQARKDVLPEASKFNPKTISLESSQENGIQNPLKIQKQEGPKKFEYYEAVDKDGNLVGYTFIASKYGYSSDVKTMVGVSPDLIVKHIKIISQSETPGLGANCEKPDFPGRFENKSESQMVVDKDGGDIVSITGATITTRTIANSIQDGLKALKIAIK